eukprot:TRINITY_DN26022_c0_g1_i1.p1 TRINITY_DN26022_c0_g1~~TRINITY_DN26022_c0_g1_i1.p1  ORF type:complete len:355 (-),score=94.17 TRINITY_DN26022_c0_g1_i1:152-1216(-)
MDPAQDLPDLYSHVHIAITSCEKTNEGGEHINYIFDATMGDRTWQVKRRFTAFEKLHEALCKRFRRLKKSFPDLPKTAWWRKTDVDYVKKKGYRLQAYLRGLLNLPEVANSPEMYNFLFKARFAVGMRASFSGLPETSRSMLQTMHNSTLNQSPPSSPQNMDGKRDIGGAGESAVDDTRNTDELSVMDEQERTMLKMLPPGSAEHDWLVHINQAIRDKRAELAALEAERADKLETMGSAGLLGESQLLGCSLHSVEEIDDDVSDSHLALTLAKPQGMDCSFYGCPEAVHQAIQLGMLLVVFPEVGTEVAVQLQQASSTTGSLCGQTVLNGQAMRFEGSLDGPNSCSGTGCLISA